MTVLTNAALDLVVPLLRVAEGLRLEAYQDAGAKIWTIGYGHTGPTVGPGVKLTHKRATELLFEDLKWVGAALDDTVKVPLEDHQAAALASLIYNIGETAWRSSTALKRLNAGNYEGAAEAMTWFNKVTKDGKKVTLPGLVNRRTMERNMFLGTTPGIGDPNDAPIPGRVTGGEHKKPTQSLTTKLASLGIVTVLTDAAGIFSQVKSQAPDIVQTYGVHIIVGVVVVGILLRRLYEMKTGEH